HERQHVPGAADGEGGVDGGEVGRQAQGVRQMRPTDADLAAFMKLAYEKVGRKRYSFFSLWEVGTELGWEREKTEVVFDRLNDDGMFEEHAIGGQQCMSAAGIDSCERSFGAEPGIEEDRRLFIRAVYESVDGNRWNDTDMFVVGDALGLDRERVGEIYYYWEARGILEARAMGGGVGLTAFGVRWVEEEILTAVDHSAADATPIAPPADIPHTEERRYAFFSVDLANHTALVAGRERESTDRIMELYRGVVEAQTGSHLGRVGGWAGDGAVVYFHGDGCQQRAVEAASGVLTGVTRLHETVPSLDTPMQARIAVHTGFFVMPDDPQRLTDEAINLVCHLQEEAVPSGGLAVTKDIFRNLSPELAARFRERPERFQDTIVYDFVQDEGEP
ncbi:MAG: hypothetical protein KKI08_18480, partial [Armatimonadetes bacterium]|nr:hypothetical protein [Armatimonadota bacterium]